jgi:hypothetical protein
MRGTCCFVFQTSSNPLRQKVQAVAKFWADMQMFSFTMSEPDPRRFMDQ